MALSLEQLQADRDAISRTIARGELSVTFSDRTTMYRSVSDLKLARDIIDGDIARLAGRPRQTVITGRKGFTPFGGGAGIGSF